MSDNERSGAPADDDLSLPKATVQKLVNEMMPDDVVCSKDTRDLLIDCCVASESNEICEKETKKTIAGEHVLASLQALGFDDYVEEVDDVFKEHKKQQKDRDKKSTRLENTGISQEELLRQQELLFAQSRQKFEAQNQ
ncbi:hypothetical protein [Absidia glauca]|uniref:Transcription factor CBF/NF-Y/archaeal histone domain-containing protein n=1 Tax=Absidia glauca TaxID=4829 RepID=A0A168LU59_ABSGL|nr:hypothetical protein [Absidia glauca]